VIGPFGEECATAADAGPQGAEEILLAEVDPAHVADTRARFPFLRDR
jgi:predicted amidohydrolase